MPDSEVIKHSVTRNDTGDVRGAPVFHWMLNYQPTAGTGDLPAWWSPARDWYLRQTIERESFWAGALSIAVTKMSSLAWELDSDAPRVRNYFQELLLAADNNQSWVNFLSRHLMDFLCTDNGAFVEVVRATSAAGSRILGLVHLDSLRCTRTGDPDYPVIYRDTQGVNHEMQPHQVIVFSDMPDPSETYYGVGHCAASRAYRGILKMAAIETYIYEKVSGKRALAVDLVGGISDKQLATAVTSAEEERVGKGYVSYMGAIVVPTLSDVAITHTRINFAELPDGFDREKEFNIGLLQYANAIGLDPQELQPLTGAALGTGTQAEVLSEKGKGKGLAAWRQQWTHAVNQFVLPDSVTFAFDENDLKDTKQKADISKTRADAMGVYIDKGIVTPSQAAQILADEGEIPDEFVPADQTPGGTLTDSEKPESEADQAEAQAEQAQAAAVAVPAPTTEQAVKERLVEFDAAMKEFREAMKEGGFNESLHPRDDEGKFTESGGGGSSGGGGHGGGGGGGSGGGGHGANPKGDRDLHSEVTGAMGGNPRAPSTVRVVSDADMPGATDPTMQATASYSARQDTLYINKDDPFWKKSPEDRKAFAERQYRIHKWSTDDPNHPVLHEMGHAAHAKASPREYSASGYFSDADMDIAMDVSGGAAYNSQEFVAEAWAGIHKGKKYNDKVMSLYKKHGGP